MIFSTYKNHSEHQQYWRECTGAKPTAIRWLPNLCFISVWVCVIFLCLQSAIFCSTALCNYGLKWWLCPCWKRFVKQHHKSNAANLDWFTGFSSVTEPRPRVWAFDVLFLQEQDVLSQIHQRPCFYPLSNLTLPWRAHVFECNILLERCLCLYLLENHSWLQWGLGYRTAELLSSSHLLCVRWP